MIAPVLWLVQEGLEPRHSRSILEGLAATSTPYRTVQLIPFNPDPPEWGPPHTGPVITHGSTRFRELSGKAGFRPGSFYDEERFSYPRLWNRYGDHLLNNTGWRMTVGEFLDREGLWDEELFVRPMLDSKTLNGAVRTFREWIRLLGADLNYGSGPRLDTELLVTHPKVIEAEWRTFIVAGHVVSSSQYRRSGRLEVVADTPDEVRAFASARAAEYAPAPVFVLDVAATSEGLRVIETNTFGCSGLYAADASALVRAVTDYTASHY